MSALKASPRNRYVGAVSDALRSARDFGDRAELPVLGGLGSLLLGQSPEELNEWSYGNAPMFMPEQGVRLPQMKRGRGAQFADTAFAAADLPALRALTAAAGRPLARAMERGIDASPLRALRELHEARSMIPMANVIKNKGGNWLNGSVEDALGGLKQHALGAEDMALARQRIDDALATGAVTPEYVAGARRRLERDAEKNALNSFIDKQLTRYIKNDMATPEDPIRALAERGVLHFEPNWVPDASMARGEMAAKDLPNVKRLGKSNLGQDWEDLADTSIAGHPASAWRTNASPDVQARVSGLERIPDEAMIYERSNPGMSNSLGFDHLIDELSNALNPESGLPRELLLKSDSLNKVSVPQAVERVSQINAWRAAQKAEADAMRANNAATRVHKEYPDDPSGMRWVQLTQQAEDDAARQALADALKYEGDTMGHCVGGYCDDVASGRSQIFSLRDKKGQPHVTIETRPMKAGYLPEPSEDPSAAIADAIVQIKGKANRKPNDEYLPFVQDFVKSGKWSDVGDLQNTGLRPGTYSSEELGRLQAAGHTPSKYIDDAEFEKIKGILGTPDEYGMAQGGPVTTDHNVYNRLLQALN